MFEGGFATMTEINTNQLWSASVGARLAAARAVRTGVVRGTHPASRRPSHRRLAVRLCDLDQSVACDARGLTGQRAKLEGQGPRQGSLCRPDCRAAAPPPHSHAQGHAVREENSPLGTHDPERQRLAGR